LQTIANNCKQMPFKLMQIIANKCQLLQTNANNCKQMPIIAN
jgi:hypothetical protein